MARAGLIRALRETYDAGTDIAREWFAGTNQHPVRRVFADGTAHLGDGTQAPVAEHIGRLGYPLIGGGEAAFDPRLGTQTASLATQRLWLRVFTPQITETISTLEMWVGGTAAGATPTLCRMGIWEPNAAGTTWTLVASTPNDTSLFGSINSKTSKALSATYSKIRGRRIAVGSLVVTAAAAPVSPAQVSPLVSAMVDGTSGQLEFVGGKIDSQADLPASFATTAVNGTGAPLIILRP